VAVKGFVIEAMPKRVSGLQPTTTDSKSPATDVPTASAGTS